MLTLIYWKYKYYFEAIAAIIKATNDTIPTNNKIAKNIAKLIHNGDNTHHHDQSITPVNFRIINISNSPPEKSIDTVLFVLLIFIFLE